MDVLALQTKLKAAGFDPGPLDGVSGPRTASALDAALAAAQGGSATDIDPELRAGLAADLERDEGRVPYAYRDTLGYLTIGVGRLIDMKKGGKLSNEEIDHLLDNDIRACIESIADMPAWQAVKDDPVRARGLLNMRFQLGLEGLKGFRNSLALIAAQDWRAAAMNLRASKWAMQTPKRASRVIDMIETGRA